MTTIVIRSKQGKGGGLLNLSEDARRRAREHLKSLRIRLERVQPLIWPEDAVSAYRKHIYAPWTFTLKSDILRRKREDMERSLRRKREDEVIHRRALYVWVFWCPGISGCFEGWWLYLIGRGFETSKYFEHDSKRVARLMELFPLIEPTLFGSPDIRKWKMEFVRCYQKGRWCGKPQGKAPIWVEIKNNYIFNILGRAEWPSSNSARGA